MGTQNAGVIHKAYQDFAKGNIPAVFAALDARIAATKTPSASPNAAGGFHPVPGVCRSFM